MDMIDNMDSSALGLGLDFSLSTIMSAFIFGVIGFYLFRHGKKQLNFAWVWIGIALMAYPLFVSGAWLNWGIGLALCGAAYYYR